MGIFKFFKEAFEEGAQEAKQEHAEELALYEELKNSNQNKVEKTAVALACPFRELLISSNLAGKSPHLFKTGMLIEKDKQNAQKMLQRDFDINNIQTLEVNSNEFAQVLNNIPKEAPEYSSIQVAISSIQLYIFTAAIDIGYITWEQAKPKIIHYINNILQIKAITSWQIFADYFTRGEETLGLNNAMGRKLIKTRINWLLSNEDSPWLNLNWNQLTA